MKRKSSLCPKNFFFLTIIHNEERDSNISEKEITLDRIR